MIRQRKVIGATVAVVGTAAYLVGGAALGPRNARAKPASSVPVSASDIRSLALATAAQAGELQPTLVQYARGTREAATTLTGSIVDGLAGQSDSFMVAIRGTFTVPKPVPPPETPSGQTVTYSVMTLVVSATTGRVTDFGLSNRYPDLGALGPVTTVVFSESRPARDGSAR